VQCSRYHTLPHIPVEQKVHCWYHNLLQQYHECKLTVAVISGYFVTVRDSKIPGTGLPWYLEFWKDILDVNVCSLQFEKHNVSKRFADCHQ